MCFAYFSSPDWNHWAHLGTSKDSSFRDTLKLQASQAQALYKDPPIYGIYECIRGEGGSRADQSTHLPRALLFIFLETTKHFHEGRRDQGGWPGAGWSGWLAGPASQAGQTGRPARWWVGPLARWGEGGVERTFVLKRWGRPL
jgi:hypothetical protein